MTPSASPEPSSTPAPPPMHHSTDVLVLGGGPAGIATALEVARRGLRVVVLEREDSVGGMAGSFEIDGLRVDHGSHRLHPVTPPAVMERLSELLGDDLQVRRRHGRLRLHDRWVDFPLRPAGLATAMPAKWLASVARDVALKPLRARRQAPDSPSYASWLRASLGPTVYDTLYAPYAEKLWGLPGEAIDAEQARVRVSADTVPKVALRVLRGQAKRARRMAQGLRRTGSATPAT
ncbi:MAG: FAD-dependent oxidoreductase, partial [Ornithinimicrobium sp.]